MLHLFSDDNSFDHRRQLAELDYITSSRVASQALAGGGRQRGAGAQANRGRVRTADRARVVSGKDSAH